MKLLWTTNKKYRNKISTTFFFSKDFLRFHTKAARTTFSLRFPSPKAHCRWQALSSTESTRLPPVWEWRLSPVLPVWPISLLFPSTQPLQWRGKTHIQPCLQRSFSLQSRSWLNLWLFRNKEQWINLHGFGPNKFLSNMRVQGRFCPNKSVAVRPFLLDSDFVKLKNTSYPTPTTHRWAEHARGGGGGVCRNALQIALGACTPTVEWQPRTPVLRADPGCHQPKYVRDLTDMSGMRSAPN